MNVVLVGHCTPDAFMLKGMVDRVLPGAAVHSINDDESLSDHYGEESVWLVNRILDGAFSVGQSGNGSHRVPSQRGCRERRCF